MLRAAALHTAEQAKAWLRKCFGAQRIELHLYLTTLVVELRRSADAGVLSPNLLWRSLKVGTMRALRRQAPIVNKWSIRLQGLLKLTRKRARITHLSDLGSSKVGR